MTELTAIMGPTCSGKTALACALVDQGDYEIISVDSVMIYRGLDIGTAKPDAQALQRYPHHLIDICPPTASYSVAQFCRDLSPVVADIVSRGKRPLLVGGTAMYFHVLIHGMHDLPESTAASKAQVAKIGVRELHATLQQIDPISAAHIAATDTQRLMRALEVYYLAGVPLSTLQQAEKQPLPYTLQSIILLPDRTALRALIRQRLQQMLTDGLVEEVKALYNRGDLSLSHNAIRSVGYRQAWSYLSGVYDYDTFVEKATIATCQYAKRQYTWFHKMPGTPFHAFGPDVIEQVMNLPFIYTR